MNGLYVVGGWQREPRPLRAGQRVWEGYDKGLVVRVDPTTGEYSTCFEYESRNDAFARAGTGVCLQASTLHDGRLYTCTQTEVLVCALPDFEILEYLSLPWFNDVHHVLPSPSGNIIVASAGLDLVLEVTSSGEVINMWNALLEDPWARFDPSFDYRTVSTKPHRAHPNFVFYVGSELWATRFEQGDAICLTKPGRSITISKQRVHDGVLHGGRLYFTTVDGTVVIVDAARLEIAEVVDLTTFHGDRTLLGWCRGVLVDGDALWIGFSRIRPTRFRENVSWIARGFRQGRATHIACYDLAKRTCVTEMDLEPAGISALYSILPVPERPATV